MIINSDFSKKEPYSIVQKIYLAVGVLGFSIVALTFFVELPKFFLPLALFLMAVGALSYSYSRYMNHPEGIKNNGIWFDSLTNRAALGWVVSMILTAFYVLLYWYPQHLGLHESQNTGLVGLFDPLAMYLKGVKASQWFVYGVFYTFLVVVFGLRFIFKYRHNKYQVVRTFSVMLFQLFFAFLIPEIMEGLNSDLGEKWFDKDVKSMWPLDYDFFDQWHIDNMLDTGNVGIFFLVFSLFMIFAGSPILTYFFGKRWYCSWVCGCGGLAETAGDPFRHLSSKKLISWQVERWLIHGILAFTFVMTIALIYSYLGYDSSQYYITKSSFTWIVTACLLVLGGVYYFLQHKNSEEDKQKYIIIGTIAAIIFFFLYNSWSGSNNAFFIDNYNFKKWYGFYVGSIFSGIIGVGFYPLLGSRAWCRFGCPMAAVLGIQQKLLSRFRITTNGGQCISCNNCSTYCEMGIDVKAYAQRGQNIVRASCVGCGVCSAVCPRGVLRLENGSLDIFEKTTELKSVHITKEDK